jgi:glycosyltransferase involved in cell wall biosynthesis
MPMSAGAARYAVLVPGGARRREDIAAGREPRRDYFDLADALGAVLIEPGTRARGTVPTGMRAAWIAFDRRAEYDVIVTLNERSGIPLAALLMFSGTRRGHVMIAHWASPAKKRLPLRLLRAGNAIDRLVVFGSAQERVALKELGFARRKVEMVLHPADQRFWHPLGNPLSGICSAGLERRDYGTLVEAMRGLDLHLTIAAASPWSKRDPLSRAGLPPNVSKRRHDYLALRELYDRSEFVVVPLQDVDFQAGSLVMYEAMAMGKAVIATRTQAHRFGDIVRQGETGLLVPPGDPRALRQAILRLHHDPAEARRLGANARRVVEQGLNHDEYVRRMVGIARDLGREIRPLTSHPSSTRTGAHLAILD